MIMALSGCDQLGIDTPSKSAERQMAEAKAVGGACRHASRAIEDCYTLNPKAEKSSVFNGWRDMDEYMRENKLEGVKPLLAKKSKAASAVEAEADSEDAEGADDAAAGGSNDAASSAEPGVKSDRKP